MKNLADQKRTERSFEVVNWVWLKAQPYRQQYIKSHQSEKLSSKYCGPFQVAEVIGKVAYRLKLPDSALIHPVFHVSQLKPFRGEKPAMAHIPEWFHGESDDVEVTPQAIIDRRIVKHHNRAQVQYLVQWEGFPLSEATWESAVQFEQRFPTFEVQT